MSKRLPYYQSEPAEYLAGDIMFCSYAAQGVFSVIRALYWQKDCKLSLKQAKRRLKDADDLIDELINENIIKIIDDNILISFLDEQFEKACGKSKTNSENGKKGAAKRWANKGINSESIATPLKKDSESIALKENNIKEDNINKQLKEDLFNSYQLIEAQMKVHDTSKKEILKHLTHFWNIKYEGIETESSLNDIRKHFNNWLAKQDVKKVLEPIKHWNQS